MTQREQPLGPCLVGRYEWGGTTACVVRKKSQPAALPESGIRSRRTTFTCARGRTSSQTVMVERGQKMRDSQKVQFFKEILEIMNA